MNMSSNVSWLSGSEIAVDWTATNVIHVAVGAIMVILSIVGNGLVIASWIFYPVVRTSSNALLVSLACVDFLIGTIIIPLANFYSLRNTWLLGKEMCFVFLSSVYMFTFISSNNLVLIAIDRYRILIEGVPYLQRRSVRHALEPVLFIWVIGVLTISPIYLGWKETVIFGQLEEQPRIVCEVRNTPSWVLLTALLNVLGPALGLISIYAKVFHELKRNFWKQIDKKQNQEFETSERLERGTESADSEGTSLSPPSSVLKETKALLAMERERKASCTIGLLVIVYLICWLPYIFITLLKVLNFMDQDAYIRLGSTLALSNSFINPMIYAYRNHDFQRCFTSIGSKVTCNSKWG